MPPLKNQVWGYFILISTITLFITAASTTSENVTLNSSISHLGRTRVCPNEIILYECFVMGPSLVWQLSDRFEQQYNNSDKENVVNNNGSISVWLNSLSINEERLKSTLILAYDPQFNNRDIECNNKSSKYIIAEDPRSPELDDPVFIGQFDASIHYLLQWSQSSNNSQDLDHYEISIQGKKVPKVFVSALDNKTIISISSGVGTITVVITAVNKCGQKSQPVETNVNTTISMRHNYIVFILAALAIFFCLICIVLMVIILIFAFRRLKHTKNLMRMKPARPLSKQSDVESHELNRKSEGFPLLGPRGSDRESS